MALPFRPVRDGLALAVRLTPKAARDGVDGLRHDSAGVPHLAARVRAVPDKGAANAALARLIAEWLEVPAGTVAVTAGHTARLKTVTITGDPATLAERVSARIG